MRGVIPRVGFCLQGWRRVNSLCNWKLLRLLLFCDSLLSTCIICPFVVESREYFALEDFCVMGLQLSDDALN